MAKRKSIRLKVLMNGHLVGLLTRSSRGVISFDYDETWLVNENRRQLSLSLPLSTQGYSGDIVENYFDNLLPDSLPIRNRLQARVGADSTRAFDLLSHIGRDCVGALQLLPEDEDVDVKTVTASTIDSGQIEKILKNYKTNPLGVDPEADFRLSVAGAQEKTAFLLHDGEWCRPHGATPTSHIFKLPIGELGQSGIDLSDSVENEWLCQQLVREFGVPIASTDIAEFGSQKVLVVERFDRKWSPDGKWLMRLPQEDMCQATGTAGSQKYENEGGPGAKQVMEILRGSERSYEDRTSFMTAQLVFWMLGAIDGHAKNFSLFHGRGGLFRLTPLYDVISIYPVLSAGQIDEQQVRMAMAVLGKNKHYRWDKISRRHWLETAKICQYSSEDMDEIISKCCDITSSCIDNVKEIIPKGFPGNIADTIFKGVVRAKERLLTR